MSILVIMGKNASIRSVVVALIVLLAPSQLSAQSKRPNIIFILSDDHTYQAISAYGNRYVQTPNIDRIAREGVRFNHAMVTNSICGPSRATLLTGKYSHKNGYPLNEKKFDNTQQTFPGILQKSGYQTAWIGKMHLGTLPRGFDYFSVLPGQGKYYNPDFISTPNDTVRMNGYVTNVITDLSVSWLNGRDTSRPFMLIVGEKATHREWLPDLPDLGAYDSIQFPLPPTFTDSYKGRKAAMDQDMTIAGTMRLKEDLKVHLDYGKDAYGEYARFTPEQHTPFYQYYEGKVSREFDSLQLSGQALAEWKYQRYMRDYLSTARSLDRNIGRILHYLDSTGLAANTVVIYASDQGFYMGEHGWFDKRFIYEESLHTPFVMRYPGVIRPGSVTAGFMLNIDWAPTLLDIADVHTPADMQGVSFMPLVDGKADTSQWRKDVYYHYYEYPEPHRVPPHFGIRSERYKLIRFYGPADYWELYDLDTDPQELHNIYNEAMQKKTIAALKKRLLQLTREYDDKEAQQLLQAANK
ncbi:sulfatase family protein [Chitinophaga rhizophila]|uniref:Sulfatase n=1 Tax=Chitinophaga rhizophila TaxID=2866212 RepID=A0ABS7GJB4_9BACT|nr:sulfatase [Chitinophaga rhizophila]MBW8687804.1 sulfatase [Chitinophaga rhizophila]